MKAQLRKRIKPLGGGFIHRLSEPYREIAKPYLVRTERLELSHLAALEPKSSVSTNSTTSAFKLLKQRRQTINLAPF